MRKSYTGVGSRETPLYILYMMSQLAMIFEKKGYILRSGCATGADAAFEDALLDPVNNAEIYVPNKGFPVKMGTTYKKHYIIPQERFGKSFDGLFRKATRLIHSKNIHKKWQYLNEYTTLLHNRNMFQVLGLDLKSPANFTVCFTKHKELTYDDTSEKTGGTGTAINASNLHNVPVFNLSVDEHYLRLSNFIDENKHLIDFNRLNKIKIRTDFNERTKPEIGTHIHDYEHFMNIIIDEKNKRDSLIRIKEEKNLELSDKKTKKTTRPKI